MSLLGSVKLNLDDTRGSANDHGPIVTCRASEVGLQALVITASANSRLGNAGLQSETPEKKGANADLWRIRGSVGRTRVVRDGLVSVAQARECFLDLTKVPAFRLRLQLQVTGPL